ncbi:MAG: SIMPL domain-containing protein [Candidatus Paceibacterota bacterium]|jgi:hypothetical protein
MNNQEKVWKVGMWVGVILAIFLAVVSLKELKSIGYVGKDIISMNTISVEGTGDAVSMPDIATFSFTVTESAKTVGDAQKQATEKTNKALKTVYDAGVAEKDVQTLSYNINPKYEYQNAICSYETASSQSVSVGIVNSVRYCPPGKSVLTGYEVSQSIQVKMRDLSKAGAIFTSIGSLGVQNVSGLSFSVDKPEAIKAEARAKAISDAKNKAETLAKQLGVSLVKITSFYESNGPMPYYGKGGANVAMMESAVAPEIPTGEQKTTINVTITYEIR